MANPWGIPRPSDVSVSDWEVAESFANEVYLDVAGDWIPQLFSADNAMAAIYREVIGQRWAMMSDPKERWLYALQGRLEILHDRDYAERIIRGIASLILPGVIQDNLPNFGGDMGSAEDVGEVLDRIGDTISVGQAALTENSNRVFDVIGSLLRYSNDTINTTTNNALQSLVDTGNRSANVVTELSRVILQAIGQNNSNAISVLMDIFRQNSDGIDGLLRKGTDIIGILTDRALEGITSVLEDALGKESGIIEVIGAVLGEHIGRATDSQDRIARRIEEALDSEIAQSKRNSDAIERGITESIDRITGVADGALTRTSDAIVGAGHAQTEATAQGAQAIRGAVTEGFGGLGKFLSHLTGSEGPPTPEQARDRLNKAFDSVFTQGNCPADFVEFIHDFVDKVTADWDPATPLVHILAEVQLWQSMFAPAFQVLGNCIAQTAARAAPTSLLDAHELREQMRRGLVEKAEAMSDLLSQGYTPEKADRLLAAKREIPDVGFVQTWFLRGFITAEDAIKLLAARGFEGNDIQNILKMAFFIPPPQDLITMAVREVFSPSVARRFGQFEDFPQDFADYARQQGISTEWAQRYWAAHWGLPSPQQGFEMYQRDVITFDDLQLLLKSLDIMPFWREKLTKIAFRPVTRVDIRRMHSLNLLTHEEMVKRYRHMGYSPEDAEFMAKFTERLNAPKGEQDVEELEGATTATVVQLYSRGAITEAEARRILSEMGKGERAINVILTNERMRREMQEREQETALIIEQAKAGILDFEEAQDRLGALGLSALELQTARTKLARIKAQETKLPTRAEADKMYKADLLSDAEYIVLLSRLGYSLFWTNKFLDLVKKEEKAA